MAFGQRFFLLSIVALKTLGLVIENTFTTPNIGTKDFFYLVDFWQYVVDVNKYGLDLTGITTLTFEVMACGEASIVMSNSEVGDPKKPMYDFIIGGENNQKSFLRRRKDDSLTARSKQTVFYHTPDVCKCDEYRPFWIRAIDGILSIGEGRIVGMNLIAEFYYPPPFTVRAIGIYTNQENVGEWKVQLEGKIVSFS
ncbi:unnamed protein product [Mytilus edulis]|uniref:Farnesoic acid O-methyl transferase domain-containing protein n=1 Tax=Mytilus edulis TaxID=6550 RepID=A0A8S3Q5H2_MYTED|nr:unnamed protein product [Mytilus edulis]